MSDIAIKVENISKKYQIGENKNFPTLRDKLMELPNRIFKGPRKNKEFWALKDVSFEVKQGEVVGIIGRNGAGKSTLLKILARITEPTSGKITMYGRVASMLEVGTGFNQELTGRENIYLNGAIIGMKRAEIEKKFADIVAFSGVEKFLDTPVKHYSSGMYVRLAFAVSAHLDADILLVDEVLAVGDAEFQKKCLGKMSSLANSGKTVIFVSHNIGAIKSLCSHCLWINNGVSVMYGFTEQVMSSYIQSVNKLDIDKSKNSSLSSTKYSFTMKMPYWVDDKNKVTYSYNYGQNITLRFEFNFKKIVENLCIGYSLVNQYGEKLFFSHSIDDHRSNIPSRLLGKVVIDSAIDIGCIPPGTYQVPFGLKNKQGEAIIYSEKDVFLEIKPPKNDIDGRGGTFWYTGNWKIK